MSTSAAPTHLAPEVLQRLDDRLAATDELLATAYPDDDLRRQPVHTVYLPGDRFTADVARQWSERAAALLAARGGTARLCEELGLPGAVAHRADEKLAAEPIEDLRLDFEDGYGDRGDDAEDADVVRAARTLADARRAGSAPAFCGIRFKSLERATRRRGLRTFDLFLSTLVEELGSVPEGLVLTLPKVSTADQVATAAEACAAFESAAGLPAGRLRFEVQVETPQLIVDAQGRLPVAASIAAGGGRVSALHYGTYDYSAALQIAGFRQALDHPAADFAKQVMQVAVAGTGVHLSDGSTNVLPVGDDEQVLAAWRLHAGLVRRALDRGFYQGWDLHPGHLPTRFLATVAFFRQALEPSAARLRAYVAREEGAVLDEPATARALARYLLRGLECGAVTDAEVRDLAGLDPEGLTGLAGPARRA